MAAAAAIFLATELLPVSGFWIELLRRSSEAALVGGLADWFAITALFRRPLGLPIPHTAILPQNKERIGEALGRFVTAHFFSPDLIKERLGTIDPAGRGADWLSRPGNGERVAERVTALLPGVLRSMDDQKIREFLLSILHERLERTDLANTSAVLLQVLMEGRQHHRVYDGLVDLARELLLRNRRSVDKLVAGGSKWWVPRLVDRRIARAIVRESVQKLQDIRQPNHRARWHFERALAGTVDRLKASKETRERVEAFKQRLLANPELQAHLLETWDELHALLLKDAQSDDSRLRQAIAHGLRSVADAVRRDDMLRRQTNRRIRTFIIVNVTPWQEEIGNFISEVVRSWDTGTMSNRVELAVGRDLQFIRMSGTLVGAVVGCLLFLLVSLVELI